MSGRRGFARGGLRFWVAGLIGLALCGQSLALSARVAANAKQQLLTACGTTSVKLVFQKRVGLNVDSTFFVDFSEATPQIHPMAITERIYYPVISPDGLKITYQTGATMEGPPSLGQIGTVWMRDLAATGTPQKVADIGFVPRFVLNTPANEYAIAYSTSMACPRGFAALYPDSTDVCYNGGQTVQKRIIGGVAQAESVLTQGSYFGGLSWDNRYVVTGWPAGPGIYMLDLQNPAGGPSSVHSEHVLKNGTNADTIISIGACNMSRSPSRLFTNTTLYYDFGSKLISDNKCHSPALGGWGEHQLLFISRYDQVDIKTYKQPPERTWVDGATSPGAGEAIGTEWYNPEWSNHPYYAAASLYVDRLWNHSPNWDHTNHCEWVYLVDLKGGNHVRLVETTDTSFASTVDMVSPYLWVQIPTGFQEDGAWLPVDNPIRGKGAIRPPEIGRGGVVLSDAPIKRVILFTALGEKIGEVAPAATRAVELTKAFPRTQSGIYFVRVETPKGKRVVRWVLGK